MLAADANREDTQPFGPFAQFAQSAAPQAASIAEAHSFAEFELDLPEEGIPITVDHDPNVEIGELAIPSSAPPVSSTPSRS